MNKVQVVQNFFEGYIFDEDTSNAWKRYPSFTRLESGELSKYNAFLYRSFLSYRIRFSQVFSYIIQLRQKGLRKRCEILL